MYDQLSSVFLNVVMTNPLKQGLKQRDEPETVTGSPGRNDESTKTRIETDLVLELKSMYDGRNDESTKTRIETPVGFVIDAAAVEVVMTNPLKQGLKHSIL